jgi:hypothetical protein
MRFVLGGYYPYKCETATTTLEQSIANSKKSVHPAKPTKQSPLIAHFTHYAACAGNGQYTVSLIDNSATYRIQIAAKYYTIIGRY